MEEIAGIVDRANMQRRGVLSIAKIVLMPTKPPGQLNFSPGMVGPAPRPPDCGASWPHTQSVVRAASTR